MEKHKCNNCGNEVVFDDEYAATGICGKCRDEVVGEMYDQDDELEKMLVMQKEYSALYKQGLIAVTTYGVHLTSSKFRNLFGVGPDVKREHMDGRVRCSKIYRGTEFFALFDMPIKNLNEMEI